MKALNTSVYAALRLKYQHVEIVSPGEQARVRYIPTYKRGKVFLSVKVTGGEYYKLNCPFCNDTRQRLYFSHLWGTRDARTRQQLFHLVTCFNEYCFDWETGKQFYESLMVRLQRRRGRLGSSSVKVVTVAPTPVKTRIISLPQSCVRISGTSSCHSARRYLESRGFDVDELWRLWRVRYCDWDEDARPKIRQRIVVPVYNRKVCLSNKTDSGPKWRLVGWQARIVADAHAESCPKYLTAAGMSKSSWLYGLPHAVTGNGPVVLVEGVTDVWRLGRDAVATFGKTMSTAQEGLIVAAFHGRPLVVAYDRDADKENSRVSAILRTARAAVGDGSPVCVLRLPAKRKDIGECGREEAWNLVQQAIARAKMQ